VGSNCFVLFYCTRFSNHGHRIGANASNSFHAD